MRVKPRPVRRQARPQEPPQPTVAKPSVVQRYDKLGRAINRNEKALCTATNAEGEPCRAYAIRGSNVCYVHGGAAPQVKRAAAVRLVMASDWLIEELLTIARSSDDEKVKLAAINSALDRAGLGTRQTVELETVSKPLTPYEQTMRDAMRIVQTVKVRVHDDGSEEVIDDGADALHKSITSVRIRRPGGGDERADHE